MVKLIKNLPKDSLEDYFRLFEESDGFDVNSAGRVLCGGISELVKSYSPDIERATLDAIYASEIERATQDAIYALKRHNRLRKTDLEFVRYLKANCQGVAGRLFYVTFEARCRKLNQTSVYQAKVYTDLSDRKEVQIFRPKPPPSAAGLSSMNEKPYEKEAESIPNKCKEQKGQSLRNKKPLPKGAFLRFLNDLGKLPQLRHLTRRQEISSIASTAWKSMPTEAKASCCITRHVKLQDVARLLPMEMQKKISELGEENM